MKTTKRFLSIMLIAMMTFCLSAFNVSAAEEHYNVTIHSSLDATDGMTVGAYKIFALKSNNGNYNYTLDEQCLIPDGYVQDVAHGGGNFTPDTINTDDRAKAFAKYLGGNINFNEKRPNYEANIDSDTNTATLDIQEKGYYAIYLMRNDDALENKAYNFISLVTVPDETNGETINLKLDVPTIEKQIKHNDGSWGKYGDNQIGDTVNFKLEITVPEYVALYASNYELIIHDKLDAGLTFDEASIKFENSSGGTLLGSSDNFYILNTKRCTDTNCSFEYRCHDIRTLLSDGRILDDRKIIVTYNATLNKDAKVHTEVNQNTVYLEYSNDPHSADSTSNTTPDTVDDWTFTANIQKIDGVKKNEDGQKDEQNGTYYGLSGATFGIYKADTEVSASDDPLYLTVTKESDGVYKIDPTSTTTELNVDDNGNLAIKGLDDNVVYWLRETKEPEGYAKLTKDVKLQLEATYIDAYVVGVSTPPTVKIKNNYAGTDPVILDTNGTLLQIKNTSGEKLVGTGGIGTTIFYIAGGVLMAGAVVLLVVKRRVNK